MIKKVLFILLFTTLFLATVLSYLSYTVLKSVSKSTNTSFSYFPKLFYNTLQHHPTKPPLNFIILGLDPRNDKIEKTDTTDTIIVARLNNNWKINLVSIPRDLWIYPLNTKINQIYPLSLGKTEPLNYIQTEFQKITDQKFTKTIIITTESLIKLTSIVGGVDVNLEIGFTDSQYPNQAHIDNPTLNIPIYKTVEFKSGINHLNTDNITEFVRSRKSLIGGTDLGRIQRQQLLLDALLLKIKSSAFIQNPNNLTALYNFYKNDIITNFTDKEIVSLAINGRNSIDNISFNKSSLPSGDNPKTDLIFHPSTFINKQWVFIPQDKSYLGLQKFIAKSLEQ